MTLLTSTRELYAAWSSIATALQRDPRLGWSFAEEPVATLRALGYELTPPAAAALYASLP